MNVCADCAFYRQGGSGQFARRTHHCTHPEFRNPPHPVTGFVEATECGRLRSTEAKCGAVGKRFEPARKPEPPRSFWAWLFG